MRKLVSWIKWNYLVFMVSGILTVYGVNNLRDWWFGVGACIILSWEWEIVDLLNW
jgi:hypothetical protein